MNEPRIILELDEPQRAYLPGELLQGSYAVEDAAPGQVQAVELSVLWHTEGKGDEEDAFRRALEKRHEPRPEDENEPGMNEASAGSHSSPPFASARAFPGASRP